MSEKINEGDQPRNDAELEDTREFTPEEIAELGLLIEIAVRKGELKID